jgi:hypothetical protein
MTCDCLTTTEVIDQVPGLTYRQLLHWTTGLGLLDAHRHSSATNIGTLPNREREPLPAQANGVGSGTPYCYPPSEVPVLRTVTALRSTGMDVAVAFDLARTSTGSIDLGAIRITIDGTR